jgi:hypothetical protein
MQLMNLEDGMRRRKVDKDVIFILHEHNGDYQGWTEIKRYELEEWRKNGSIEEGDLVVFPQDILIAEKFEEIQLKEFMGGNDE